MTKLGSGGGLTRGWRRKPKGVSEKQLKKVMKSKKVIAGLDAKAQAVQAYWQSIAPVFDPNDPAKEHRKEPARGYIGSYKESIKVFDISDGDSQVRRVKPTDWKSKIIEFGNVHMPVYAPMAKTKARFRK